MITNTSVQRITKTRIEKIESSKNVACRTGGIFLRFSGERGQARGEREVRDTRASRTPGACPRSPEKRKKITPVPQASKNEILCFKNAFRRNF